MVCRSVAAMMLPVFMALVVSFPVGLAEAQSADAVDACDSGAPPAWFLGIVHDDMVRDDFEKDVDNFEFFLDQLRGTHCIPETSAEILAFFDDYTRNGKTYAPATETNLESRLQAFGAAASAEPDATFFFFLSSHGIVYASSPCSIFTMAGSLANLRGDSLYDCELGAYLNDNFAPHVRMAIVVDCSLCGGFSDSITPASGTVPDGSVMPSGILGPNRIVVTGCAETTECFGGPNGGVMYGHLRTALAGGVDNMDGWTAPGFPTVQGVNLAHQLVGERDGTASMSEWFFRASWSAYASLDWTATQQQFRIKYGPATLEDDIPLL